MPATEHSAGIVIYRNSGEREYLLLDYGGHWDYAKGHIERGETARAAAVRELKEETGIASAEFTDGFAQEITYFFRDKKKGLVHKSVIFFLAATDAQAIQLSDEHVGFAFLPFEQAVRKLTFASAREVLRKAEEFLNGQSAASQQKGDATGAAR
jgi:8-oxo-dGTP pyrophosphatase MutT (NUDIX family)